MKKSNKVLIFLVAAALCLSACDKTSSNPTPAPQPEEPVKTGELISVTGVQRYTSEEFISTIPANIEARINSAFTTLSDWAKGILRNVTGYLYSSLLETGKKELDKRYPDGYNFETYQFRYSSISFKGEPIILSGQVTFPVSKSGITEIDSYSVLCHAFYNNPSMTPTSQKHTMFGGKCVFNSAAVEADLEGYGISEMYPHSGIVCDVLARQLLDCTLAATSLMNKHGVHLSADGCTDIYGVSLGAPTAILLHKYLETEAPEEVRNLLKLRSTISTNGPLDVSEILEYFNEHPDFSRSLAFPITNLMAVLPGDELGGYKAEDFYNPGLKKEYSEELGTDIYDVLVGQKNYQIFWEAETVPFSYIYHPDMLTADGNLDFDSEKTRIMLKALKTHSSCKGWAPVHPIYISGNTDDNRIPWQTIKDTYDDLESRGGNVYLAENSFLLNALKKQSHSIETLIASLLVIGERNPEEAYKAMKNSILNLYGTE